MDIAIFYATALCSPYVNRRFGGTYHRDFLVENLPNHVKDDDFFFG
jgi:hypothetical protein